MVTGGGKSIFALACMAEVRATDPSARFVIIVPTVALADQWVVGLGADLGVVSDDIAMFGGGATASHRRLVNVAVVNSARSVAPEISRLEPTMLIVDECHRVASKENSRALVGDHIATLGLSATPQRDWDSLFSEVVEPALGPVIYEYGYNEASADGAITPFALVNVEVPMAEAERVEYERLTRRIRVANGQRGRGESSDEHIERLLRVRARVSANVKARLPMAIRLVERNRRERAIIFHESIDAANILFKTLISRQHRAAVYHSGLGAALRQDNLRMFRSGEVDVLVTCRALDEGINVPDARVAVIAASTAATRQRIQRLGRVLRPAPGKTLATVYTIYATTAEEVRLRSEADHLQGAEAIHWLRMS